VDLDADVAVVVDVDVIVNGIDHLSLWNLRGRERNSGLAAQSG